MTQLILTYGPYIILALPAIAIIARIFAPERKRGEYNQPTISQERTKKRDGSGDYQYPTYDSSSGGHCGNLTPVVTYEEQHAQEMRDRFLEPGTATIEDEPINQPGIAVEMPVRVTPDSVFARRR